MNPVAIVINGIFLARLLLGLTLAILGTVALLKMMKGDEEIGPVAAKVGGFIGLGLVILWAANEFVGGPSFGTGLSTFANTLLTGNLENLYLQLPTPPPG